MKVKSKQSGITLTEMMVVVAVVALLVSFGLPAVRTFLDSLASSGSAKAMISAGLASARAIAAKEQRYAGFRFQKAYHPEGPLEASQYMIFIIHDAEIPPSVQGNLGCCAIEGLRPVKLPDSIGAMDLVLGSNGDEIVDMDTEIDVVAELVDVTTFSILFSPSGKLLLHTLKAQKRSIDDDVFNTENNIINNRIGMFIEDQDSSSVQPVDELSRRSFIIYDRKKFRQAYEKGQAYSGYLEQIAAEMIYINPYTGTIISKD